MLRPCVQKLLELAPALVGKCVVIRESLSRSRAVGGHDRHFAASSQLRLTVQRINTLVSGSQLQFDDGAEQWYGIALDAVVEVTYDGAHRLQIVEQFETRTERLSDLRIVE